jgi:hypothetical protein
MTKPSSARPPVPSAADSTHTAVVAPVIAFVTFVALGGRLMGTAGFPFICVSCAGLILLGFAASIWGFYVAAFYGPKKHISTAILGFILNVTVIVAPIVLARLPHRSDDNDYQDSHEARASQGATDRYRN